MVSVCPPRCSAGTKSEYTIMKYYFNKLFYRIIQSNINNENTFLMENSDLPPLPSLQQLLPNSGKM